MGMRASDIGDIDDGLRRMKELNGVDMTADQLVELTEDWLQLLSGLMAAVVEADRNAASEPAWSVDIATGKVAQPFTPAQEQARERLQRIAKETHQTLLNRYRTGA
jgi:hypothetical protein